MKNSATVESDSDAFDTTVNYVAEILGWASSITAPKITTNGGGSALTSGPTGVAGAFRNDAAAGTPLSIKFETIASANPLLKGDYTDKVTLTIEMN